MRSTWMAAVSVTAALSIALGAQAPLQQADPTAPAPAGRGARGGGRGQTVPNPAHSRIKVYDFVTKTVRVVFSADGYYESPDFSADGRFIRFNTNPDRKLFHVPVEGGQPVEVGVGFSWGHDRARNRDGSRQGSGSAEGAMVFLGPNYTKPTLAGGPFYLHTISPDGEWLAGSCGGRVCRIRWPGGGAFQMVTTVGGNDNSDYSADGKYIYFESTRSGKREIWRMPAEGAGADDSLAERVSDEPGPIRFPHPSPDGKWIAFMVAKPGGDPRDVTLRITPTPGAKAVPGASQELLAVVGGQGMMHRNSWSPDSTKIAFSSFEP